MGFRPFWGVWGFHLFFGWGVLVASCLLGGFWASSSSSSFFFFLFFFFFLLIVSFLSFLFLVFLSFFLVFSFLPDFLLIGSGLSWGFSFFSFCWGLGVLVVSGVWGALGFLFLLLLLLLFVFLLPCSSSVFLLSSFLVSPFCFLCVNPCSPFFLVGFWGF